MEEFTSKWFQGVQETLKAPPHGLALAIKGGGGGGGVSRWEQLKNTAPGSQLFGFVIFPLFHLEY